MVAELASRLRPLSLRKLAKATAISRVQNAMCGLRLGLKALGGLKTLRTTN